MKHIRRFFKFAFTEPTPTQPIHTTTPVYQIGCSDCGRFYDSNSPACPYCTSKAQYQQPSVLTLKLEEQRKRLMM
jgi:uncharacterized paraquat-inducible protein A